MMRRSESMKQVLNSSHYSVLSLRSAMTCRRIVRFIVESIMSSGFLLLVVLSLTLELASAQESGGKPHILIEPYLMIPAMTGEISVRRLPASEVDADAGDIFGHLKFGAMLYAEVNFNDKWSIAGDFLYMNLEQDIERNGLITGGAASAKQLAIELAGLKPIAPWLEAGIGARVIDMKAALDLNTIVGSENGSTRKTWVDPIIILRAQGVTHEKWLFQFRGDLGGFGVGSDFTWQIQANVGYRFSKLVHGAIGYRVLDMNYDKGDGTERFMYDVTTSGPVIRVGFSFE